MHRPRKATAIALLLLHMLLHMRLQPASAAVVSAAAAAAAAAEAETEFFEVDPDGSPRLRRVGASDETKAQGASVFTYLCVHRHSALLGGTRVV